MPATPPRIHFHSPYERPSIEPSYAGYVTMSDGAQIAAFVYGELGPLASPVAPVLMLHGNGEEHGIFGPIIDAVVATGRAVVAIDSRAQGKSTRGRSPLTYELMADDALAVLDALGVVSVHVLGFSDGGIEALLLARDHAERLRSLTAVGANLTPEGVIEDEEWDLRGTIAAHRAWYARWTTGPVPGVNPELLTPTPQESAGIAELLQLMFDEPHIAAESLETIACPTTIIVAEFDCITEEETEAIHKAIAGSKLVVVPEAGHVLPKEAPEVLTAELLELIAKAE